MEARGTASIPNPLSSRALHHRTRGVHINWRPWLKSNQQDAVLETAPAPLPHGQSGVNDEARTRYQQIHNLPAHPFAFIHHANSCAVYAHTARERRTWRRTQESNPAIVATRDNRPSGRTANLLALSARFERASHPYQRCVLPTERRQPASGADHRARTGTFLLTRQAHCHSCSIRVVLARRKGVEPSNARETTECNSRYAHAPEFGAPCCFPPCVRPARRAHEIGCGRANRTLGVQLMRLAVLPTARPAMNERSPR